MSDNSNNIKSWLTLRSEEIFSSRWLRLRKDACLLPSNREINDFYVVEVPDGAAIVAITKQKELILVRQYKHGFGQVVLELPAGIVEADEESTTTIIRELREETGYEASTVEYITTLVTKPSRMLARTQIYFALDVEYKTQHKEDDSEIIETVLIPISELTSLIKRGDIITETSLAALLMVWNRIMEA